MTEIKQIFKKLLIFFVIVILLDYGMGMILKKCYFAQKDGYDYRTTYVLDSVRSDMLVIGSSMASHHYNPAILDSTFHLSTFNGGRDGCNIFYYYGVLKSVLKRYHPKVIVMDMMPDEFETRPMSYQRVSILLPYYDSHPELKPICELKSGYEKFKLLSKIYPYNSKLLSAITAVLHIKQGEKGIEGYLPLSSTLKGREPVEILKNDMDTVKVAYFKKFVDDCNKAGVKLMVTISPIYVKYNTASKSISVARQICSNSRVPFLDYSHDASYSECLFADPYHLNKSGANLFTRRFAVDIKHMMPRGQSQYSFLNK